MATEVPVATIHLQNNTGSVLPPRVPVPLCLAAGFFLHGGILPKTGSGAVAWKIIENYFIIT